ncbi:MAG: hypothetical protein ACOYM3_22480 [Terrimicrobiaceae bacterium]
MSREILWIVEDGLQNAVNRALPQLRLQAGRFADPVRNRHEKDDFKYVGKFVPSAAPAILFAGDDLFTPKWKQGLHIGRHRGPRVGFRGKSDHAQNLL